MTVDLELSDTIQADGLRHTAVPSIIGDTLYLAVKGCYKTKVPKELQEPSRDYWEKIHALYEEIKSGKIG